MCVVLETQLLVCITSTHSTEEVGGGREGVVDISILKSILHGIVAGKEETAHTIMAGVTVLSATPPL